MRFFLFLFFSLGLGGCATATPQPSAHFAKGVALGLFGQEPPVSYHQQLDEIRSLGATHVSFVVSGFVNDIHATDVFLWRDFTPDTDTLEQHIRYARSLGLSVMVFPILRLAHRTPAEWRGILSPTNEAHFLDSYEQFILRYAMAATREGASSFVVGSELNSTEHNETRWRAIIAHVRAVFPGMLLYSANWDHYEKVPFWDALDAIGISAYYEVATSELSSMETGFPGSHPIYRRRPEVKAMAASWLPIRHRLAAFSQKVGRPIYFTELGYPSQVGAASRPWDHTRVAKGDEEEQRRCFEAFARAFGGEPSLLGAYVWIWFEKGGFEDTSYTPRGKLAEIFLRDFYRPRQWLPPPR